MEFLELTPYEFSLLVEYKKDNDKGKYQLIRNVIYNAGANLMRKKNSLEIPLFDDSKVADNIPTDEKLSERQLLFGDSSE